MKIPFINATLSNTDEPNAAAAPSAAYVITLEMADVHDPFDADAIWAGKTSLLGMIGRSGTGLKALLEQFAHARQAGKASEIFAHVEVYLPAAALVLDQRTGRGTRTAALIEGLTRHHKNDFEMKLVPGEAVRYRVLKHDTLQPGKIVVRFGHGVYVPAPSVTTVRHQISWALEGGEFSPVASMAHDQRLLLVGANLDHVSVAVADWPFGEALSLVFINDPAAEILIEGEPFPALRVEFDKHANLYRLTGTVPNQEPLTVLVKVETTATAPKAVPAPAPAPAPAAVTKPKPVTAASRVAAVPQPQSLPLVPPPEVAPVAPTNAATAAAAASTVAADAAANINADGTYHPVYRPAATASALPDDGTFMPLAKPRYRISLAGLCMQRVSSYAGSGVDTLDIGFDDTAKPAAPGVASRLSLHVDRNDELRVSYRGGRSSVVSLPTTFPPPQSGGSALWLEPAPSGMESHCVALVRGEWGYVEPLWPGKSLNFGRQEKFLSALRVMDGLGFVTVDPNSNIPLGDKLGLSRKALSMQVEGDQLVVTLLSTTQVAYHLDQDRKLVAKLSSNDGDPTTARLEPGHHVALAHYLFAFEAIGR